MVPCKTLWFYRNRYFFKSKLLMAWRFSNQDMKRKFLSTFVATATEFISTKHRSKVLATKRRNVKQISLCLVINRKPKVSFIVIKRALIRSKHFLERSMCVTTFGSQSQRISDLLVSCQEIWWSFYLFSSGSQLFHGYGLSAYLNMTKLRYHRDDDKGS